MRHNKKFNHLGRKKGHRDAMLANMTISLIQHKRIFTTLPKAKALRVYAEPLINRAKTDSTANRRLVFSYLQNKEAIKELFNEISQKIANRPGGYTRILKTKVLRVLAVRAASRLPKRLVPQQPKLQQQQRPKKPLLLQPRKLRLSKWNNTMQRVMRY